MRIFVILLLLLSTGGIFAEESQDKVEVFFVGSNNCGASKQVVGSGVLPGIVEMIRKDADLKRKAFTSVCVNIDSNREDADSFTDAACDGFDQVMNTDGLQSDLFVDLAFSPPSPETMEFAEGKQGVPFLLIRHTNGDTVTAERYFAVVIVMFANWVKSLEGPLPERLILPH